MKTVGSGQSAATRCREFFLRRNSGQDDQPATLNVPPIPRLLPTAHCRLPAVYGLIQV